MISQIFFVLSGEGDSQSRGGAPDLRAAPDQLAGGRAGSQRGIPRPLLPHPGGAGGRTHRPQAVFHLGRKEHKTHVFIYDDSHRDSCVYIVFSVGDP